MEANMMIRRIVLGVGAVVALAAIAVPLFLIPGAPSAPRPAAMAVPVDEQAATIAALAPPRRTRPVIAIATRNEGTEVSDFLSIYGIIKRADLADVSVVAEHDEPVRLYYSTMSIDPDATLAAFDQAHPDGADYVLVPAMDPGTDPAIAAWLKAQRDKGATIVSVCNGSRMLSTAGLLTGRRATGHWSARDELRQNNPTMQWVPDRRYVVDDRVMTSTGITANIPSMIALVEAIGGRDAAARIAADIGVATWDARHDSEAFALTLELRKTFVRNIMSVWRRETLGVPVADGVDEVAMGLMVDAYSRTQLGTVVVMGEGGSVTTRSGLTIHVDPIEPAKVTRMLPAPPTDNVALTLETVLPDIVSRYDRPTADIVALAMEYPWPREQLAASNSPQVIGNR
jgi:putative intracellular protease/amidase